MTERGASVQTFHDHAVHDPDRIAFVGPDGRRTTFGEAAAQVNALGHLLRDRGLRRGDTVAALIPNEPEMLVLHRAVLQLPLYFTPINWHLVEAEVAYVLQDCGASILFTTRALEDLARRAADRCGLSQDDVLVLDAPGVVSTLASMPSTRPPDEGAGERLLYTSGTTGHPKAVLRPLGRQTQEESARRLLRRARLYRADDPGGAFLSVAPLYHASPLGYANQSMEVGQTVVILPRWEPAAALRAIEQHGVTWFYMVPLMFTDLLSLPEPVRRAADVSTVRSIFHTAAPCPPHVKRRMIDWFGPILVEMYGGTEGAATFIDSPDWLRHPGSVGRPQRGVSLRILREDGAEATTGEVGSIYFRNREAAFVYRNAPEKTEAARDGDFVTMGDRGYLDPEGYLFLCDRGDDLIVSGGVNIYPAEVENALLTLPGVRDACVVGRPDDRWGESVHALLVTEPGSELASADLKVLLADAIAGYKIPRSHELVERVPRSPAGKLQRRRARADVLGTVPRAGTAG